MPKKTLTIHVESEVLDQFKNHCRLNALKLSAKVELLLKQEMENAKTNPTLIQMFQDMLDKTKIKRQAEMPDQTHMQYVPRTDVREIIREINSRNNAEKDNAAEAKEHIIQGDLKQMIKEVEDKEKKTPTLDQLKYRKGL